MNLAERDLKRVWHPCMQMKEFESTKLFDIKSAKGVWLEDFDGNRYIDAISSWWVNLFGHSNEYLNSKLTEQLNSFAHIMTANFTHEPMVKLSERLCKLTGLDKVFFADNGSSAIEVALKMSFQFHKNRGKVKNKFVCFKNSYHGETLGALSIGDVGLYKSTFEELLLEVIVCDTPLDKTPEQVLSALHKIEATLDEQHNDICAIIIEPLVQCAGGMKMHSPEFITGLRELCDAFGILLILDEIAVGFGRTGSMFAYQQAGILPDILCLSKGITGGYMPLSVAVCTDKIYDAFYDEYESGKAFLHSHSYSGNALSCALANGVLDIFEQNDIFGQITTKSQQISHRLADIRGKTGIFETRQCGMIAAIELKNSDRIAPKVFEMAMKRGVFLRPIGNVIYTMPPFVIEKEEIDLIFDVINECVGVL